VVCVRAARADRGGSGDGAAGEPERHQQRGPRSGPSTSICAAFLEMKTAWHPIGV